MKTRNAGNTAMFVLIRTRALHFGVLLSWALLSGMLLSGCQGQDAPESQEMETTAQEEVSETAPGWIDAERVTNADSEPENWLVHGRTNSEQRYSPLTQINESNVGQLGLAWYFDLDTSRGQQATPLIVDGLMYTTSAWSKWWKFGGGGTAWDSFAYDPDLDLFYIGTGNGSPWSRTLRSPGGGDNLFLASIVAVRPDTGEYVWHYQTVPGDTWDYTAVQHMILAELEIDGRERKVIMQAPKNGFFYVLDRETGELLSAEKIMPANWASHIDIETGRPVETPDARYDETGVAIKITPGPDGAHSWHPMSYSPDTGLVYIPAQQAPMIYRLDENFVVQPIGVNLGVNYWDPQDEFKELPPEFGPEAIRLFVIRRANESVK